MIALSLLLIPSAAQATTVDECQAAISALKDQATNIVITGKDAEKIEKDRAGLLGKLDQASLKLDQAKFCDVLQKVGDFQSKVDQLVKAGEINADPLAGTTAEDLLSAAADVMTCVRALSEQSGGKC